MLDGTLLVGFIVASVIVLLIPGPGVLYVVARSVGQGYRAGLASVVGLSAGALVHVAAAAVGLSAILLTSATAFGIVKLLGAAYLIYLGVRTLLSKTEAASIETPKPVAVRRLFTDGVIVSVLNPKIAVFFLAYLPQFVDPTLGSVTIQIALLGLIYCGLALLTDGTYALLGGSVRHWIGGQMMQGRWPRRVTGGIYIGLGIHAALADVKK